jgi:FtsZ-interacting cell division protein ZipA
MKRWYVLVLFIVVAALFPAAGSAGEEQPYFTNKDIEKYSKSPDAQPDKQKKDAQEERKSSARLAKDKQEQERWCKLANDQREKIEKAQYEVTKAEKDLAREKKKDPRPGKKNTKVQDRLDKARHLLSLEKKKLDDLENEAHRKGVPPGWLRCQFD